ncbi:hypothetical protein [Peribacillus loiseleuriae]|uniref:hypothetical protein n=1 Tax=Peribacillus loiseleuriae TaxID=1679170 RepID=UPI003D03C7DC
MRFVGIDPSTKTGFVALEEDGSVLRGKELTGVGTNEAVKMCTLIDEVIAHILPGDIIAIEGFGYKSDQATQLGGIGWGIRMALCRRKFRWIEAAPMALKKFAGATGNKDSEGKAIKSDKKEVARQVNLHWGYGHSSDNVIDAFVLAQIAKMANGFGQEVQDLYPRYQIEVVQNILYPEPKAKKKRKKAKA